MNTTAYKTTLYDITGSVADAASLLDEIADNTDISEEERILGVEEAMARLASGMEELPIKLDGCARFIKSIEAEIDGLKNEERRLATRRRSSEARAERFKDYVTRCLAALENRKIKTPGFSLSLRRSESLEIVDARLIPQQPAYWRNRDPEPDKMALRDAVKNGALTEADGVAIRESYSLQIK